MGARGSGANPLRLAWNASRNPKIRPRRKREVHLAALDRLWSIEQPKAGSRLKVFERAIMEVARHAGAIGINPDTFDDWVEQLRFEVDDRDMDL